MSKQPIRRRRVTGAVARTLAVGVGVAALVAIIGVGPVLAIQAPPDERILERQGRIDHQAAASQADEQGKAEEPSQSSPAETRPRYIRPEPNMGPPPQFDEQAFPTPVPEAPDRGRGGLIATVAVATVLLLALGGAATWWIRHRRPQPEPTRPQPESSA
jgi:hypothetical protein